MAFIRVLYAGLFVSLPQLMTVFSSSCGSKARPDPDDRGAPGWQLCYIKLPEDEAYASTRCSELASDLQPLGTDTVFQTSQELLDAGGNFGCWYDTEGLDSDIQKACKPNRGHHVSLASQEGSNILGLCILYPPVPELTTAETTDGPSCGTIARHDTWERAPVGWVLCYIQLPQDEDYINTKCTDLIHNVKPPETDSVYETAADLLEAGGHFGCWYDTRGQDGSLQKACKPKRGHHVSLSSYEGTNILALCIQSPYMATSTVATTPGVTTEDTAARWWVVGTILAVLLVLTLAALSVLVFRRFNRKKPSQPQALGLVSLLRTRSNSGDATHVYNDARERPTKSDVPPRCLLRLPSLPGEETIYEDIPDYAVPDEYEVPMHMTGDPHDMTATQNHLYMDMGGAEGGACGKTAKENTSNDKHGKKNSSIEVPPDASPDGACGNDEGRYANMH